MPIMKYRYNNLHINRIDRKVFRKHTKWIV